MRLLRVRVGLIIAVCLAVSIVVWAQVDTPTQVAFTCSADQATLTGYQVRSVVVASGAPSAPVSVGVPTPVGGICTVSISTAAWSLDVPYRIEVRSVRGSAVSAWVPTARTGIVPSPEPPDTATYYVSTSGLDSNPGTLASPFRTIHKGVSILTAGDTLLVRNGTYTNDITDTRGILVAASGTSLAPITIKAESQWGARVVWTDATDNHYGFFVTGSWVVLDGFDLTNASRGAFWIYDTANHTTLQNNKIRNCRQSAIFTQRPVSGTRILGNYIYNNGTTPSLDHGIYTTSDDTLIANNVLVDNAGAGVQVAGYTDATNVRIYNNAIAWNGQAGVWLFKTMNGIYIRNNILYKNRYAVASYAATGTGVFVDHNDIFGNLSGVFNTTEAGSTVPYTTSANITTNPLFVSDSATDPTLNGFRLQSGSPARDIGTTLSEAASDILGVSRPQGSAYDAGAYEYVP